MSKEVFNFLSDECSKQDNFNYLSLIKNKKIIKLVKNFFEKSVVSFIPREKVLELIDAINDDLDNHIFGFVLDRRALHTMNEEQLNSKTHKLFLEIVKDYFGESAYKTLSERKNLNIFNTTEIHVLHQEIFDNFGASFVNRILNNDLTPQSLIVIKDILTDKEKMEDFRYFYNLYESYFGLDQVNFEKMIRGYDSYKSLIKELRCSNLDLSDELINTLSEVFNDYTNKYNICDVQDLNNFYLLKNKAYDSLKNKSLELASMRSYSEAVELLTVGVFKNFYGLEYEQANGMFSILNMNAYCFNKYYDIDEIINNKSMSSMFSDEEIEALIDLKKINQLATKEVNTKEDFKELLTYCKKYEKKGNKIDKYILNLFNKVHGVFAYDIGNSISKINDIKSRAKGDEIGIYENSISLTVSGKEVDLPVYVLDGADFAFVSSTVYPYGFSGHKVTGDLAKSWFEYENGTTHISCSYSTQNNLTNLEFQKIEDYASQVTYIFDDVEMFMMGPEDIFTPELIRISNVNSGNRTKIMSSEKLAFETKKKGVAYNEVGISRYSYSGDVRYGGKIIPSAILCCDNINDFQLKVAKEFSEYCVKHGLKEERWKMPLILVNKEKYLELEMMKSRKLINKNSECFLKEDETLDHLKKKNNIR